MTTQREFFAQQFAVHERAIDATPGNDLQNVQVRFSKLKPRISGNADSLAAVGIIPERCGSLQG